MTSKSTTLVHIKLDYEEALQTKRDMLSSQADLIKLLAALKRYKKLRQEELRLKSVLKRKLFHSKKLQQ